jgi:hypothetical protein
VVTKFAKAGLGGAIAGEVFLCVLSFKLHQPQHASINKGTFLVSRHLLASGRDVPSNVDRVHKFWAKYRSAAHIWAAMTMVGKAGLISERPVPSESEMVAQNEHILLVADALFSKAKAAGWPFDPDPWKLPDAYPRKSLQLDIGPPPSWEIDLLKKEYHAPRIPK